MNTHLSTTLTYYDNLARDYDRLTKSHEWVAPHVLFGMCWPYFSVSPESRLLDLGAGTGLSLVPFRKAGFSDNTIVACDGSKEMLAKLRGKYPEIATHRIDLSDEWPNLGRFDVVVACGLIYFLSDLHEFVRQAKSTLKPSAILALNFELPDSDTTSGLQAIEDKHTGLTFYPRTVPQVVDALNVCGLTLRAKTTHFAYHSPSAGVDRYCGVVIAQHA